MKTMIDGLDDQIDKLLPQLINDLAQLMIGIRTHHRHNEKVGELVVLVAELTLVGTAIHDLARRNCVHDASTIGRPVVSKPSVAHPSGSGEEGEQTS